MNTLYLDIFSGISGDMFIGAMIDLGVDPDQLGLELEKLGLECFHLHVAEETKAQIAGIKFDVHEHDHDHDHEDEHECHEGEHEHGHGHAGSVPDPAAHSHEGAPHSPLAHQYFEALRRGERHLASQLVMAAVAAGTPVKEIYLNVFQPAQYEIGRLWQTNRISVAQEHYCTAATQLIMSQLYPHIFASAKHGRTLIATCVAGDLHEIGVRMVADFFEMAGWNTFYLGANTPHSSVVATIAERTADVLAISATIAYHVDAVQDLIRAVRQHPGTGRVKILVGGYPFNRDPELWRKVGADGSALDAQQAIMLADQIMPGKKP